MGGATTKRDVMSVQATLQVRLGRDALHGLPIESAYLISIITTIAGNGGSNFADGVPAVDGSVNRPEDLAFDRTGNLYVADNALEHGQLTGDRGLVRCCGAGSQESRIERPSSTSLYSPDRLTTRPGVAPVDLPCVTTARPLTRTCSMPTEYLCG